MKHFRVGQVIRFVFRFWPKNTYKSTFLNGSHSRESLALPELIKKCSFFDLFFWSFLVFSAFWRQFRIKIHQIVKIRALKKGGKGHISRFDVFSVLLWMFRFFQRLSFERNSPFFKSRFFVGPENELGGDYFHFWGHFHSKVR